MAIADGGLRKMFFDKLPKPYWDWTPMETGGVTSGVPDAYWHSPAWRKDGWVEFKKTHGWAVELRPHQAGWLKRHARAGVRCTLAVRGYGQGSSGGTGDSLWILRCDDIDQILEKGLQCEADLVLARFNGGPRTWDWSVVSQLLLRDPVEEALQER